MERTYGLHDLAAALRRRRALALGVTGGVLAAGIAVALLMPSEYAADSVVQIEPRRLPPDFFPAEPVTPFEDRMRTLKHGILARPVLERVIREADLYPDQRADLDGAVEKLRRNVEVRLEGEVAGGPPSLLFVVEVRGRDPAKVAKAADLLPRYYADLTRQVLADQARSLRGVLDAQADGLSRLLAEGERKIADFKAAHATELPEAIDTNAREAGRAQALVEMRLGMLAEARRRRASMLASVPEMASEGGLSEAALDLATRKLEAARAAYGPDHPDVLRARREWQEASQRRAADVERFRRERVEPQLAAVDAEVKDADASLRDAQAQLALAQKRMEAAPGRGAELLALTRDYETLRAKYVGTVSRRADAAAAESLLALDAPGLFRVIQPAVTPGRPVAPDRARLLWMALAAALAAGLGAAAAAEWIDPSLRGPEDATALGAPVLAAIPRIVPRRPAP